MADEREPGGKEFDGFGAVRDMLKEMDEEARQRLLDNLAKQDPELVQRLKDDLFSFSQISLLRTEHVRELVGAAPQSKWAIAVRTESDEFRETLLGALSKRGADDLRELFIETPPQKKSDVLEAQKEILDIAKKLESDGKIVLKPISKDEKDAGDEYV